MKWDCKITNLDQLDKYIHFLSVINGTSKDERFMKFMKERFMETLNSVIDEELKGGTTNDEYISAYKQNNKIEDTDDGFVLYNDTMGDISELSKKTQAKYPNGFSIALAFEYGVGIVGENTAKIGAWEYNVNKRNFAWTYKKNGKSYSTYGYEGMEIYRKTAIKINNNLGYWLDKYVKEVSK